MRLQKCKPSPNGVARNAVDKGRPAIAPPLVVQSCMVLPSIFRLITYSARARSLFGCATIPTPKVGAGPGGLQLGSALAKAGRSYAIFERELQAGSFFSKMPVHRKLISLNKRFTGRIDPEFNLRHDWNSLLDNERAVPVRLPFTL